MTIEGLAMAVTDGLAKALLIALASLEDLAQQIPESASALKTLENIASELSEMEPDERVAFLDALDRAAAKDPAHAGWIQSLATSLGVEDPRR